jgi:putative mRNA 3-end processing factor
MALIEFREQGLYCPQAEVYIDPWRPVSKALITHAHMDHARWGHNAYLCSQDTKPLLKARLGESLPVQGLPYGESVHMNGVEITFFPAGHIVGSAQIRLTYKGEIWCISGDYKLENDGISTPFEPVSCHHFITESTFGLPSYRWRPSGEVITEIKDWWRANALEGRTSVIAAYALGKAQRLVKDLQDSVGPIVVHPSILRMNEVIAQMGYSLPQNISDPNSFEGCWGEALVIAPPGALASQWIQKNKDREEALVSGWMQVRGHRRRRGVARGFVISDHADWTGLNQAVQLTGADHIYVTHGFTDLYARYLSEQGYKARVVKTDYGKEDQEEAL